MDRNGLSALFVSVKSAEIMCRYICAMLWDVIGYMISVWGRWGCAVTTFHCRICSYATAVVCFSYGVICPEQRCANFIDGGLHFRMWCAPVGQCRGAQSPGAMSPGRLYFVIFCGSSVWNVLCVTHLAPRVLRLLLDFGEVCATLP
jgi:hypothetical protein